LFGFYQGRPFQWESNLFYALTMFLFYLIITLNDFYVCRLFNKLSLFKFMNLAKTFNSALKNPKKALMFLKHRIFSFWGTSDFVPFVIMGRSRTGSNLLISYLNKHPNIFCEGEKFALHRGKDYKGCFSFVYGKQPKYIRAKGCKVFYYHPDGQPGGALQFLLGNSKMHVLHLKRRNILKVLVSHAVATRSRCWVNSKASAANSGVTLSPSQVQSDIDQTLKWEEIWGKAFREHRILDIYYEDLVSKPQETLNSISSFLNCPQLPDWGGAVLARQSSGELRERIHNYHELRTYFLNSKYIKYFD